MKLDELAMDANTFERVIFRMLVLVCLGMSSGTL